MVAETGLDATLALKLAVIWLGMNHAEPGIGRLSPDCAPITAAAVTVRSPARAGFTVGDQKLAAVPSGDKTNGPSKLTLSAVEP